jgi:hypothetical protein
MESGNTLVKHQSECAPEIPGYGKLQHEIRDALLAQHPEWVEPDGDCPTCDDYDRRFAELLSLSLAVERPNPHQRAYA